MTNEEKMQEKYMQFQMLQQQVEQITEHVQMLHQQNAELEISINAVKELGETKVGNEILAPIANGIFFKAELKENKKLVVNVGSNTTVEKTVDQVVELLEEQKKQLGEKIIEAESVLQELHQQSMSIYKEVEGLM